MPSAWDTAERVEQSDSGQLSKGSLRPLFTVENLEDDSEVLKWCRHSKDAAVKFSRRRNQNIRINWELYSAKRGTATIESGYSQPRLQDYMENENGYPEVDEVIVNHLYDLTENKVAKYVRYRPIVDVSPAHSADPKDRFAAIENKNLLEYIRYVNPMDLINAKFARQRTVAGEAYLYIGWDANKGYIHPEIKAILDSGLAPALPQSTEAVNPAAADSSLESVSQATEEVTNEELLPTSDTPAPTIAPASFRTGDICFSVPDSRNIFLQPIFDGNYDKVDYLLERELVDVDILRSEHPDKAGKITLNMEKAAPFVYDWNYAEHNRGDLWGSDLLAMSNFVEKWTLWHRSTAQLPEGRKIVFTNDVVLSNEPNPYEDFEGNRDIPYIRLTDLDIAGELYGQSIYIQTRHLNEFITKLYTLVYRNQMLVGHPKWFLPEGARVSKEDLGNDITFVRYSGNIKPELQVFGNTPKEVFALIQSLESVEQKLFGIFGISRGDVPPGIEAGIALQFLEEQENSRMNADISKQNYAIKKMNLMVLDRARQFYHPDDQRLLKIYSKDQTYQIKTLNPVSLSTPVDIRIEPSGPLSESKAARLQYLITLDQRKPLPDDIFLENAELGIPEAYATEITYAKKSADLALAMIVSGMPEVPVIPTDDLLTHWQRTFMFMQNDSNKMLPPDRSAKLNQRLLTIEALLMGKAFVDDNMQAPPANPALAQILLANPNFPVLYKPNQDLMMAQVMMAGQMAAPPGEMQQAAMPNAPPEPGFEPPQIPGSESME